MKFLFICTHNRCRSILADAVTNHCSGGKIIAKSAGSQPVGQVHPLSIKYLQEAGISASGLSSDSWDQHETWSPDVVITVCDSAANETCPVWFGDAIQVHWGLPDPSKLASANSGQPSEEVAEAFRHLIRLLEIRIRKVLTYMEYFDLESTENSEFRFMLDQLGSASED